MIYWYLRCHCNLWKNPWFYCDFWVFSYIIEDHSCLKYCIFTKLPKIVYLDNVNILKCQNAKCNSSFYDLIPFLGMFIYYYVFMKLLWSFTSKFYKLCVKYGRNEAMNKPSLIKSSEVYGNIFKFSKEDKHKLKCFS